MAARSLALDQMYRVLRGLPGTMTLQAGDGRSYLLTVENPNAPANRCQETAGLSVTLDGPQDEGHNADRSVISHLLSDTELAVLRTGEPLTLMFGSLAVDLQSNPGGHLVDLGEDHGHAAH